MINQQTLELYVYVDGINDVPFLSNNYQEFILANGEQFVTNDGKVFNVRILNESIIIHAFTYNAKRMGSAPTITTTIKYPECLDELFSQKVYATFNGEKYFLVATPSSSYSNEEIMYKHEATFVSERIALENTYFYDVVPENAEIDEPVSNNSDFVLSEKIDVFATRMNYSLQYAGLQVVDENGEYVSGYRVVLDEGISSEEKFMSVENKFFSEVLQEVYNTYDLPYYFVGKEIHIGYTNNAINEVFRYGDSDALMSITKSNTNNRIINRATGIGSEDNIPYYYPNKSPEGDIRIKVAESNSALTSDDDIRIVDYERFAKYSTMDADIELQPARQQSLVRPFDFYGFFQDRVLNSVATKPNVSSNEVTTTPKGVDTMYQISYNITNVDKVFLNAFGYLDEELPQSVSWSTLGDIRPSGVIPTLRVIKCNGTEEDLAKFKIKGLRVYWILERFDVDHSDETWHFEVTSQVELQRDEEHDFYMFPNFNDALDFNESEALVREDMGASTLKFEWDIEAPAIEYELEVSFETYNLNADKWVSNGKVVTFKEMGLELKGTANVGDKFKKVMGADGLMPHQNALMPPIYRQSLGGERFYNAENGVHLIPDENDNYTDDYYVFGNEYVGNNPKEQIVQFEEIKPTIKGATNTQGLRIDMFSEFAYDENDNGETYEDGEGNVEYKHPIFFGKLRKLDFNLFDHALEDGEMEIHMTTGNCSACVFKIAVDADAESDKPNLVQVDENGDLVRFYNPEDPDDERNGDVICARPTQVEQKGQPEQQDTKNNEVWLALYKDIKTFGEIYPNGNTKPKGCSKNDDGSYNNDGDTFVITHINMPQEYIDRAEDKLYQQIIYFLFDNNVEKFKYSIKFSRIYFAEHPEILALLDENARLIVEYDGVQKTLYVSSLSYKATENEILPEITVELAEEITVAQNSVQKAANQVKAELYQQMYGIDVIAQGTRAFLRKDQPDTANAPITFNAKPILAKGAILDEQLNSKDYFEDSKGLSIHKDKNNNWHIEADYLYARKKFSAKEVEIQKMHHIGGAQIKSSASMICSRVADLGDSYRCWFDANDDDGYTIYNQFIVGDQAYVQTFNLIDDGNGNTTNHYYWRLVTAVDDNSITLSKIVCADGSTKPMVGDHIVQLGYQGDDRPDRQVAVIDAGAGVGAPYYRQYVSINSFALPEPETQLKPNDNKLKGQVDIKEGSLLSGVIAIKDENDDKIVAVINGADNLVDDNGRKLVVAAGVTNVAIDEEIITNIEATTKIFDDGTLTLGDKVGMTGADNGNDSDDSSIRIWAGADNTNKEKAPFRVLQDGRVIATEAEIAGTVNAKNGTFENGKFNNVTLKGSVSNPVIDFRGTIIDVWDNLNEEYVDFVRRPELDIVTDNLYAWADHLGTTIYSKTTTIDIGFVDFYYNGTLTTQYEVNTVINRLIGNDGIDKHDNLAILVNTDKRHFGADELSWDVSNSGRLIRLVYAPYDSFTSVGYAKLYAPSGKYFFEDGEQYDSIIFSNQIVELFGYGTKNEFYGWIVTNRKDVSTEKSYGASPKVLYQGVIKDGRLSKIWNPQIQHAQQELSIEYNNGSVTLGVGLYRDLLDVNNWEVFATNAYVTDKAVDAEKALIGFRLVSSHTNGGYMGFQVVSTADWATLEETTNE